MGGRVDKSPPLSPLAPVSSSNKNFRKKLFFYEIQCKMKGIPQS